MAYTTIKKPSDYFNTKLYTGTGSSNAVTGVGFQPDWVWVKNRSTTSNHRMVNAVTGSSELQSSNITNVGPDSSYFSSFDSDGFTIGTATDTNNNGSNFASWNWLANGTGVANTDGSTNSTVSVNTTAGFSVVKWTGTGSGTTIGHGLGAVPKIIFVKNISSARNWVVNVGEIVGTDERSLYLNATDAIKNDAAADGGYTYNNTTTTFSTAGGSGGTQDDVNKSGDTIIAYCFADVQGYSKFGSYVGNGNVNGTFVYTGFKPAFVIVKCTSASDHWIMYDNKRNEFNLTDTVLYPNLSNADNTQSVLSVDLLSQGFKFRGIDGATNGENRTYIYIAFASEPLVGDNPATAR